MKIKRNSKTATQTHLTKDIESTAIILLIKANPLNSLVTLKTLKVLKILIALKALIALLPPDRKANSIIDNKTIDPSNMFILSLT